MGEHLLDEAEELHVVHALLGSVQLGLDLVRGRV